MRCVRRSMMYVLPSFLIAACAPATLTRQYAGLSPVPVDQAYLCARAFVDSAGYTLTSSDRPSGIFRASHDEDVFIRDEIAVTILARPDGQTQMYATAESYTIPSHPDRQPEMVAPTGSVQAVADLVVYRCARSYRAVPRADSTHS